jgi:transcriptional regulator with XRE-family HTH domain
MESLRTLRHARGWTRAELARRSGLNASTVGLIEAGRLVPYPSQLTKLAKALGVPRLEAGRLPEGAANEVHHGSR